ncbi:MAG: succinylglutamate desuccinylase/aspartoacylase family protein [Lentisphaerota bacterium]
MHEDSLKFIEVSRNSGEAYQVPYWELNSGRPGPAVLVIGAMHGNEIQSPEIIRRFREIATGKLIAGSCVLIPFCNPVAVHGRHAHIDFEVGRYYGRDQVNNLNCSWPGDPNGSDAQRLSYALFNTVVQKATHCIDLHCWQSMTATTVLPQHDNPVSMGMATATRLPFMKYNTERKTKTRPEYPCILTEYFNDSGRPALAIEFSGQFLTHHHELENGTRALLNIFKSLKMMSGEPEGETKRPIIINAQQQINVSAPVNGLFVKSKCRLGGKVQKGESLGHVFSDTDITRHEILSPAAGWLFRYGRQEDSSRVADPLTAYHVYASAGETVATIIIE